MDTVLTRTILLIILFGWFLDVSGQVGVTFDLKKPKKYENKKLASEKTDEKKFTAPRHFIQNAVTKFNWHFNANNKLNEVIARAKAMHKDDYTQLLSFYPYTLDQTARQKTELDSVIYKANTGILIHDLRNDWIDNMYMLMGKAYYFKKILDTAYITFQYINFAFAPKEKDGYDKPIGSNANDEGNALSISTKENRSIAKKLLSTPPSRNESFIWQIRTHIALDEMPEAAGLIETLKHDPQFPGRLQADLHEVQALWFYHQQMNDSAAFYLEKALDNAGNKQERARWEYLIAQLYEKAGKSVQSQEFYDRAIRHTLNPVMDVYARLNIIRQNKGDEKIVQQNIDDLLKMARRDRYVAYRDVLYTAAAQMELERNNVAGARALLLKAAGYITPESDPSQRTKIFLQLADLSYREKQYAEAKRFYDSLNLNDPAIPDPQKLQAKKNTLDAIVFQLRIIERQDSLQRLAAMPDREREAFIRKIARQLRKQKGLKEEENITPGGPAIPGKNNAEPTDLFNNNEKGDWYFYNPSVKAKGFSDFRARWGNRPNVDNWQRATAVNQATANREQQPGHAPPDNPATVSLSENNSNVTGDLSYEGLLKKVPLTPEQVKVSNDSIENALFRSGKAFVNGLEDYTSAITAFELLLDKFPASGYRAEALFNLYYCYQKTGNTAKAQQVMQELQEKYKGTQFEKLASHPHLAKEDSSKTDMTRRYEQIYNLFIEGRFDEALAAKKMADSLYNNNYWTPQLLYIQSIYHVRQRQDDSAKKVLQQIMSLFPSSPLSAKAQTMLDVLNRRKEIEDHLTRLKIERPAEDSIVIVDSGKVGPTRQTVVVQQQQPPQLQLKPPAVPQQGKPPVQAPAVAKKPDQAGKDSVQKTATVFSFNPDAPHYAAIVLDKVDQVYVNETRNAFNRYNKEKYYNKTIGINTISLDENIKLVLMDNFENAAAAADYVAKTAKAAPTGIIPWLPAGKYSFVIISTQNLEVLKNNKDLAGYKKLLTTWVPAIKW